MNETTSAAALCSLVSEQRLPRWDELPDLDLYMDQVLSLMERYLGSYPGYDRKGLTASMVNNYVKLGVIPPPVKKKYTRTHIAYLIMICILKASLPIDSIGKLISLSISSSSKRDVYQCFCDDFEISVQKAASGVSSDLELKPVYQCALRAQAEQALARKLLEAAIISD